MAYIGEYHPPPLPRASWKDTNVEQSNLALRTPALYRHIIITDSLLCPWGKKALTFSLNSTRLTRTLSMSPSVSVLTRFDCIIHFKLCPAAGFVLYCSVRFVSTTVTTGTVSKWWPYLLLPDERMANTDFINAEIEYISKRRNCLSSRVTEFQVVGKRHKALKLYLFNFNLHDLFPIYP